MGFVQHVYYSAMAGYATLARHREIGSSIFDADWDICIVLDSARVDLLREVASGLLGRQHLGSRWSMGSCTTEWLASTFRKSRRDEIADCALVTAQPHTQTVFDDREWLTTSDKAPFSYPAIPTVSPETFEALYRLYERPDGAHGVVKPQMMHDATLAAYQRHGRRVVAHWLQPHEPFIAPDATVVGGAALEANVWEGLADGRLNPSAVWHSYRANLAYAVKHVKRLLDAVDARVLITADHGNLWDVAGQWGHPFGCPHPQVRKVPWLLIDAERRQTHSIDMSVLDGSGDRGVRNQLAALGYA